MTSKNGKRGVSLSIGTSEPGYALVRMLFDEASLRGDEHTVLSEKLGVSPGYFTHLRGGRITADKMSKDLIRRIAKYLGISPIGAMILADQIPPDFFTPADRSPEQDLDRALRFIAQDEEFAPLFPEEFYDEGHTKAKYAFVRLYESARGTSLIPQEDVGELLAGHEEFRKDHPNAYQGDNITPLR
ncbi:MAG: helix-turn-helix domain-containing protein [Halorhodospira sp.]